MITRPEAAQTLARDLQELFGPRLKSVVAYAAAEGPAAPQPTLAVVNGLSADDLHKCAHRVEQWQRSGLATPLLLEEQEFSRSLDAFPFEFGAILADHTVVAGASPFEGVRIDPHDLRRACEIQARSHLLHLREGYMETGGRSDAVAALIERSSGPLAALVHNVARLEGHPAAAAAAAAAHVEAAAGLPPGVLGEIVALAPAATLTSERARALFPSYLSAVHRLTVHVDQWSQR
jgi:hypothetical protein